MPVVKIRTHRNLNKIKIVHYTLRKSSHFLPTPYGPRFACNEEVMLAENLKIFNFSFCKLVSHNLFHDLYVVDYVKLNS